jgi:spermidine synthase
VSTTQSRSAQRWVRATGWIGALAFAAAVALGIFASLREGAGPPGLSIDPRDFVRGFAQQGDLERVLGELDAELRLDPPVELRVDLLLRSGRLLSRLGRHADAAERFERASSLQPERVEPRLYRIAELAALRRNDEILPEYREILARLPNDAVLRANHAYALERVGQVEGARAEYETALRLAPALPQANFGLGRLLLLTGRPQEAWGPLARAAELQPLMAGAHALLARALRENGRREEAIETYRRALALEPRLFGPRTALAQLLIDAGRRDEAVAELRLALAQSPDDALLLNNLAWLLATAPTLAPGAAEEAVALAERASTRGADAAALDTLAAALAAAGRYDEAGTIAMRALHRARESGDVESARAIAERRKSYLRKRRHVDQAVRS